MAFIQCREAITELGEFKGMKLKASHVTTVVTRQSGARKRNLGINFTNVILSNFSNVSIIKTLNMKNRSGQIFHAI